MKGFTNQQLSEAYNEYLDWCSDHGEDPKTYEAFVKQLKEELEIGKSIEKCQGREV